MRMRRAHGPNLPYGSAAELMKIAREGRWAPDPPDPPFPGTSC
jgi:hypothetical protein